MDRSDGGQQEVGCGVFGQETGGAGLDGADDGFVMLDGGQNNDFGGRSHGTIPGSSSWP